MAHIKQVSKSSKRSKSARKSVSKQKRKYVPTKRGKQEQEQQFNADEVIEEATTNQKRGTRSSSKSKKQIKEATPAKKEIKKAVKKGSKIQEKKGTKKESQKQGKKPIKMEVEEEKKEEKKENQRKSKINTRSQVKQQKKESDEEEEQVKPEMEEENPQLKKPNNQKGDKKGKNKKQKDDDANDLDDDVDLINKIQPKNQQTLSIYQNKLKSGYDKKFLKICKELSDVKRNNIISLAITFAESKNLFSNEILIEFTKSFKNLTQLTNLVIVVNNANQVDSLGIDHLFEEIVTLRTNLRTLFLDFTDCPNIDCSKFKNFQNMLRDLTVLQDFQIFFQQCKVQKQFVNDTYAYILTLMTCRQACTISISDLEIQRKQAFFWNQVQPIHNPIQVIENINIVDDIKIFDFYKNQEQVHEYQMVFKDNEIKSKYLKLLSQSIQQIQIQQQLANRNMVINIYNEKKNQAIQNSLYFTIVNNIGQRQEILITNLWENQNQAHYQFSITDEVVQFYMDFLLNNRRLAQTKLPQFIVDIQNPNFSRVGLAHVLQTLPKYHQEKPTSSKFIFYPGFNENINETDFKELVLKSEFIKSTTQLFEVIIKTNININVGIMNHSFFYHGTFSQQFNLSKYIFEAFLEKSKYETVTIDINSNYEEVEMDDYFKQLNLNECADTLNQLNITLNNFHPIMLDSLFTITQQVHKLKQFTLISHERFQALSNPGCSQKEKQATLITVDRMKQVVGIIRNNQNLSQLKISLNLMLLENQGLFDMLMDQICQLKELEQLELNFWQYEINDKQSQDLVTLISKQKKLTIVILIFKNFAVCKNNNKVKIQFPLNKNNAELNQSLALIAIQNFSFSQFQVDVSNIDERTQNTFETDDHKSLAYDKEQNKIILKQLEPIFEYALQLHKALLIEIVKSNKKNLQIELYLDFSINKKAIELSRFLKFLNEDVKLESFEFSVPYYSSVFTDLVQVLKKQKEMLRFRYKIDELINKLPEEDLYKYYREVQALLDDNKQEKAIVAFKDFQIKHIKPVRQYLDVKSERILAKQQKEINARMKFLKECVFENIKQYTNLQLFYNFENHNYDFVDDYFNFIEKSVATTLNISVSDVSFVDEYWTKLYQYITNKKDYLKEFQFEAVLSEKKDVEKFLKTINELKILTKLQFKITTTYQPDDKIVIDLFNEIKTMKNLASLILFFEKERTIKRRRWWWNQNFNFNGYLKIDTYKKISNIIENLNLNEFKSNII